VNRENIFLDVEDKEKFLELLDLSREIYQLTIHSFCILDNHYHLLLETSADNLSLAVRYINSRYAEYFNKKMDRIGPLWQGRFKSWYVHDDNYLWLLLRYIEMNPVKAGLADHIGEYPFSASYYTVRTLMPEILSASSLYQKDIHDWLLPLKNRDLEALTNFQSVRFEQQGNSVQMVKAVELSEYFNRLEGREQRNAAAYRAFMEGHKQNEIARHLKLSVAAVCRIVDTERTKREFFRTIRDKGLFWSYAQDIEYDAGKKKLLIETVLKYADLADIRRLFNLFGKRDIKLVWETVLKPDVRFKKLNYFLARIFFNLNVEADDFSGVKYARAEKLRLLAG
jgi:REP element-mobilizing transposase RayT